jgi:hypothetical protein
MARSEQYMQGRREAIKWAVTWLHAKAERMNDTRAAEVLNVAATDIGAETRDGQLPAVKRAQEVKMTLRQLATDHEGKPVFLGLESMLRRPDCA